VFNGEIYNFLELRDELIARGYVFHSDSDSEVILAAFDYWGEGMLNRFNGMWALAIVDYKKKRLFLSRDRFGKKPLFYAFIRDKDNNARFIFASEMKAIYPFLREIKPTSDFKSLTNINNIFNYEASEKTLIDGIYRFKAAHFAYITLENLESFAARTLQSTRYYHLLDNIHINKDISYNEAKERFRALFLDSVRIRMRSDVSIGTALSGGVDSSATMCAMAHLAGFNPSSNPKYNKNLHFGLKRESSDWQHACVACFKGTRLDESKYARAVCNHIGIEGEFLEINPLQHWERIEEYFYLFEDVRGFDGKGYGIFKEALAEIVISALKPIRERYLALQKDEKYIMDIVDEGAHAVQSTAQATYKRAKDLIGLV